MFSKLLKWSSQCVYIYFSTSWFNCSRMSSGQEHTEAKCLVANYFTPDCHSISNPSLSRKTLCDTQLSVTHERQGSPVSPMAIFLGFFTDHINRIVQGIGQMHLLLLGLYTSHQTDFPAGEENPHLATAWLS